MITEDYVSFEVAKLLKEKGFPQMEENSVYHTTEIVYSINADKEGVHHLTHRYPAVYDINNYICAPTLQMTMKWLREEHNIHIKVHCSGNRNYLVYAQSLVTAFNDFCIESTTGSFNSYEQACEEAIKYCLENLI